MEIKSKRLKSGLTQGALAEKIGVHQTAVAHWEAGIANPDADKIPKIAEVLGCSIEELFKEGRTNADT